MTSLRNIGSFLMVVCLLLSGCENAAQKERGKERKQVIEQFDGLIRKIDGAILSDIFKRESMWEEISKKKDEWFEIHRGLVAMRDHEIGPYAKRLGIDERNLHMHGSVDLMEKEKVQLIPDHEKKQLRDKWRADYEEKIKALRKQYQSLINEKFLMASKNKDLSKELRLGKVLPIKLGELLGKSEFTLRHHSDIQQEVSKVWLSGGVEENVFWSLPDHLRPSTPDEVETIAFITEHRRSYKDEKTDADVISVDSCDVFLVNVHNLDLENNGRSFRGTVLYEANYVKPDRSWGEVILDRSNNKVAIRGVPTKEIVSFLTETDRFTATERKYLHEKELKDELLSEVTEGPPEK
jgi:hypothetical protein